MSVKPEFPSFPQPGQMRVSAAWEDARRRVWAAAAAQDVDAWLLAIAERLTVSEYEVCRADAFDSETGKPSKLSWVSYLPVTASDAWSVPIRTLPRQRSFKHIYEPFLSKTLLPRLAAAGCTGLVFVLPATEGRAAQGLSIRQERKVTGGGHNDSPTYEDVITFALVDVYTRLASI